MLQVDTSKKSLGFLINTTGCQHELILPFDERYPEIKEHFKILEPMKCGEGTPALTELHDGMLKVGTVC